jgi:hypothetical protein
MVTSGMVSVRTESRESKRLRCLRMIRERGHVKGRPYGKRKAELLGFNEHDGAIWRDAYGYVRCSRQEMAIRSLHRAFRSK